jgi:hypothetical protein
MEAMGKFVEKSLKDGILVDTGGLLPSKDGARVRLANGKISVTDGPFTESKEVIGGWAILNTDSKAEAVRIATEFMELHRKHWPGFDGESEVRLMFEHGVGGRDPRAACASPNPGQPPDSYARMNSPVLEDLFDLFNFPSSHGFF